MLGCAKSSFLYLIWQFYEILWNIIVSTKKNKKSFGTIWYLTLAWKEISKLMILKYFEYKNVQKYQIKIESSIQFENSSIFNKFFFWVVCHFFFSKYVIFLLLFVSFLEIGIFNNRLIINKVFEKYVIFF